MENTGIIVGYRLDLNRSLLGLTAFKNQFAFLPHARPHFQALERYCAQSPTVTSFIQQLGSCRLECNLEAANYEVSLGLADELREKFAEAIESVTLLFVRDERFIWSTVSATGSRAREAVTEVNLVGSGRPHKRAPAEDFLEIDALRVGERVALNPTQLEHADKPKHHKKT